MNNDKRVKPVVIFSEIRRASIEDIRKEMKENGKEDKDISVSSILEEQEHAFPSDVERAFSSIKKDLKEQGFRVEDNGNFADISVWFPEGDIAGDIRFDKEEKAIISESISDLVISIVSAHSDVE